MWLHLAKAQQLARRAVELHPDTMAWQVLGWAQYRCGEYGEAIEALEKSIELQEEPPDGDPWQWFFLAMAHWKLDHRQEARRWFDKAEEWDGLAQLSDAKRQQYQRFRAEAADLLAIEIGETETKEKNDTGR